jgi:membrane protein YdbS with pleckstrin-like domain
VPASLTMFQGEYALAAQRFWIPIHPFTLILLITALVLNWNTARRKFIIATIVGYAAVLAITTVWFVPELLAIPRSTYSNAIDPLLTQRGATWELYSLIRLAFLILLAISLLFGLSKPVESLHR